MDTDNAIYLDNNATTPLDERVLAAMMPYLTTEFGNAGSLSHGYGRRASDAVEAAREQVAQLLGVESDEIIFTSGATESDNLAIKGAAEAYAEKGRHIITSLAEHKAVLDVCRHLERGGCIVSWLKPDEFGRISSLQVREAIREDTVLISLMAANNETGVLHPVQEFAEQARRHGIIFHTDATQAAGKVPLSLNVAGVDLASVSGHKIYGPKGIGALYVRRRPRVRLTCQLHGGGQERELRSGTLNVAGIVGLGAAAELAGMELGAESARLRALRDRLYQALTASLEGVTINGHADERLPNTLNISFEGVEAAKLIERAGGVAMSSGSACTSAVLSASYVLKAMGLPEDRAFSAVRLSLGRFNSESDVDHAATEIISAVKAERQANPALGGQQKGCGCNCKDGRCG